MEEETSARKENGDISQEAETITCRQKVINIQRYSYCFCVCVCVCGGGVMALWQIFLLNENNQLNSHTVSGHDC